MEHVAKRIQRHRSEKGWSLKRLAELANIKSIETIVRLEHGKNAHHETIDRVADALEVNHSALVEDNVIEDADYRYGRIAHQRILREIVEKEPLVISEGFHKVLMLERLLGGSLNIAIIEVENESTWRAHKGEEVLYAIEREMGLRLAIRDDLRKTEEIILQLGEVISFWGDDPHQYFNPHPEGEPAKAFSVWVDSDFCLDQKEVVLEN